MTPRTIASMPDDDRPKVSANRIRVVLRGGPNDGRTMSTIGDKPPEHLVTLGGHLSAIATFAEFTGDLVVDAAPRAIYYRGARGDEDLIEYYHDPEVARVARAFPGSREWVKVKPDRFQGRRSGLFEAIHLVATLPDGRYFSMLAPVDRECVVDQITYAWRELEYELEYELLPTCVVPECAEKAPVLLRTAEMGWFAGRLRDVGDEIRLCPRHHHDVMTVSPGGDENLPEWLAADARYPAMWGPGGVILRMVDTREPRMSYGGLTPFF